MLLFMSHRRCRQKAINDAAKITSFLLSFILALVVLFLLALITECLCSQYAWMDVWCLTSAISLKVKTRHENICRLNSVIDSILTESGAEKSWEASWKLCTIETADLFRVMRDGVFFRAFTVWFTQDKKIEQQLTKNEVKRKRSHNLNFVWFKFL